jgi:hypothetical protein
MGVRTNTELKASTVSFIAQPHEGGAWGTVECPRCSGIFKVDGKRWRAPLMSTIKPELELFGRPCPYCFMTALVPAEFYPRKRRPNGTT